MAIIEKIHGGITYFLKRLFLLTEFFLFLRLILKFLNASGEAFAVKNLYKYTDILVWPFNFIFPNFYVSEKLIDMVTISAMVGYFLALIILLGILRLIFRDPYAL